MSLNPHIASMSPALDDIQPGSPRAMIDHLSPWEELESSQGLLLIQTLSMLDSGLYQCQADNDVGKHSHAVQLEVYCKY